MIQAFRSSRLAVSQGMKKPSSLIASKHCSRSRSQYGATHCPVCRMNARAKRLAPVYSRRANSTSNEGEIAVGPGPQGISVDRHGVWVGVFLDGSLVSYSKSRTDRIPIKD